MRKDFNLLARPSAWEALVGIGLSVAAVWAVELVPAEARQASVQARQAASSTQLTTTTFSTPGTSTFTVPQGVTTLQVTAVGGRGGSGGTGAPGGFGAQVTGTLAVAAGSVLYVDVGANGSNGGGQGSASGGVGGGGGGGTATPMRSTSPAASIPVTRASSRGSACRAARTCSWSSRASTRRTTAGSSVCATCR